MSQSVCLRGEQLEPVISVEERVGSRLCPCVLVGMKVKVLLFAAAREIAGEKEFEFEDVPEGTNCASFLSKFILNRWSGLATIVSSIVLAVNHEYIDPEAQEKHILKNRALLRSISSFFLLFPLGRVLFAVLANVPYFEPRGSADCSRHVLTLQGACGVCAPPAHSFSLIPIPTAIT